MPSSLVDTNILVYAHDQTEGTKRYPAIELLNELARRNTGMLSTQVLGEFFHISTRKIPSPLMITEAEQVVADFVASWTVYNVTAFVVTEAIRGVRIHQLAYYDSLLWATAHLNQIASIITEDGQHGRMIEGVRYLNPFHPDFDVKILAA